MIDQPSSWFEREWVLGWAGLALTVIGAIIAAILNRKSTRLEREKLKLEISSLKNDPEVIADRREIYERLRVLLRSIANAADVSYGDIGELHSIIHDASFRFPDDLLDGLRSFLRDVLRLHSTNKNVSLSIEQGGAPRHSEYCEQNASALERVLMYGDDLIETFKAHVSR